MRCFSVHPPTPHTSVTYLCWKTGCCSCLLGTQDVIQAARYLVIRNWQPLSCHSSRRLRLNETCQAKQASVTNKQSSSFFFFFGLTKWEPQTNSLLRSSLTIWRFPHTLIVYMHAHAHAHTDKHALQCTVKAYPCRSDFKRNKEIKKKWIADTSSLPCPFKLNYTC